MAELGTSEEISDAVRERYAAAARSVGTDETGCCGAGSA